MSTVNVPQGRTLRFTEEALTALESYRWPGNVRELQNLVESLIWTTGSEEIRVENLPAAMANTVRGWVLPARERRRQLADDLFTGLVNGTVTFWAHLHPLFLNRDITRHDLREVVRRGLAATSGNYRAMLKLFGIDERDYKRFLNFLAAHDCGVDFRTYRGGAALDPPPVARRPLAFPEAIDSGRRGRFRSVSDTST
jgi:DNA-binding NtrC family response regulator